MMFGGRQKEEFPRSDELRRVLDDAITEAANLGHEYIGTEHVLLALVSNRDSAIAAALARAGITEDAVRKSTGNIVRRGHGFAHIATFPLTSRTKAALSRAADVAHELGQTHVTPEHLVAGLMREQKNIAAQILQQLGLSWEAAEEMARDAR